MLDKLNYAGCLAGILLRGGRSCSDVSTCTMAIVILSIDLWTQNADESLEMTIGRVVETFVPERSGTRPRPNSLGNSSYTQYVIFKGNIKSMMVPIQIKSCQTTNYLGPEMCSDHNLYNNVRQQMGNERNNQNATRRVSWKYRRWNRCVQDNLTIGLKLFFRILYCNQENKPANYGNQCLSNNSR